MKTVLFLLALSCAALHAQGLDTNSLTGNWNWEFTMPDSSVVRPKIKLIHQDSQLSGFSMIRPGTETAITNASVRGHQVRFEVMRVRHGVSAVTRYAGKWEGDIIKGTFQSDWAGAVKTYPWEARRYSSLNGNWKWASRTLGGRGETRAQLKLEEGKLIGWIHGRDGRDAPVTNATFENGEVTFELERDRDGVISVQIFKGTFEGGTIVGTIEYISDAAPNGRKSDWKAERVE